MLKRLQLLGRSLEDGDFASCYSSMAMVTCHCVVTRIRTIAVPNKHMLCSIKIVWFDDAERFESRKGLFAIPAGSPSTGTET